MKSSVMHGAVAAGAFLCASSFLLPPGGVQSPAWQFRWILNAAVSTRAPAEAAVFGAVALLILYPFGWAAAVLAMHPGGRRPRWMSSVWPHLLIHSAGGLLAVGISVVLLLVADPWIPTKVLWTGAFAPPLLVAVLWWPGRRMSPDRRAWTVMALGFAYFLALAILLARFSRQREEQPVWGFAVGGAGAVLALGGSAALASSRRKTGGSH